MAAPFLVNPAFTVGEISPSLYGRADLARFGVAATTMRNHVIKFTGGAMSRAGTRFVGFSKQTTRDFPPRLIPFQFNVNQGLALEFGNFYMRVIQDGAFVIDTVLPITGVTQTDPAVVTTTGAAGAATAVANNAGVTASYNGGDTILLAGGVYTVQAELTVSSTLVLALFINAAGSGYVPADTITLAGGTISVAPIVTVVTTQVSALPTIAAAGAGGTPGSAVVTGTTGTGTFFQANVTIDGAGAIVSVDSLVTGGAYTVNPTVPAAEPVTGGGLAGAQLSVVLGVRTVSITNAGVLTANPPTSGFTQSATSGVGTGATFRDARFGISAVAVTTPGIYTTFPANPVAQDSTSGIGFGATFTMTTVAVAPLQDGDWVQISGVVGMTELNGETFIVQNVTTTTFELFDVYGTPIDSNSFGAYVSGGVASRIYTLTTPYAEQDLKYLKFTQSRDVMSLCLVNQISGVEYETLDLARNSNSNWEFEVVTGQSTIAPPATLTGVASAGGTTNYKYVVTAVNPEDGTESIASVGASILNAVNIAATAGTITLTWSAVEGVKQYNIYKATPGLGAAVPVGALFGYAGSAYGTQFIDTNIIADFSQVPPQEQDPFARGVVTGANVVSGGAGYTTMTLSITTGTGTGAILTPVIVGGALSAILVINPGRNYRATDVIVVTGDGTGAAATLQVGPLTGTYPAVPAYFQQRRVYGYTLNQPDTYFMSQPASFTNFDRRIPTIDTDAITGSPWATQINGIQQMLQMPGGLVVLSGLGAWQLTGNGGSSFNPQPITPSAQDAQPQAFNGCNDHMPAIKIDYDILYVQQKGAIVRNFSYQYYQNIYTGADLTLNSAHLFTNFQLREWAWTEEPYKVVWAIREDDGVMLSLTYVKPQEVAGWARHDTNGSFVSVCAVTEPPVDALYLAVHRLEDQRVVAYMIERMDDRIWETVEDGWCVDCGIRLPQPKPDARLIASSARGPGSISGFTGLVGGSNYSAATTAVIIDDNGRGPGTGATVGLTIVAGVITVVTVLTPGSRYTYPALSITDPSNQGSGASAAVTLNTNATFNASAPVFGTDAVGQVLRMGGGIATITARASATQVTARITTPITKLIPNSGGVPRGAQPGQWTMTTPVTSVSGLKYLANATVTGTYDGHVLPPVSVPNTGVVLLPAPASAVTIGLGFRAQLQSTFLNLGGAVTIQGQRKAIQAVTVRLEASRGAVAGSNQPDGAAQSPPQIEMPWTNMAEIPESGRAPYGSTVKPLFTGDVYVPITAGFGDTGQTAVEQSQPLPLTVLAFVSQVLAGDIPEDDPRPRREQ